MKKKSILLKSGVSILWILFIFYLNSMAQNPYSGTWEGKFMNDFKTVLLLDQHEESAYTGKILMYSGGKRIQDDEISEIIIENRILSFYIAAKETKFEGKFNDLHTNLKGNFIFPDKSVHPLTLRKYNKDSLSVNSENPPGKEVNKHQIPVDELKSDLKQLIIKLKKYHPRLYSYTSEEEFENRAKLVEAQLETELRIEDYYLRIAPLIESVNCSHTGIRMPRDYQQTLREKGNYFPLELFISGNKAYNISKHGYPGTGPEPGCEILSINKKPIAQIIEQLLNIIPSEGARMSSKYQELNRDFPGYFHFLDQSESFDIEYANRKQVHHTSLEACNYSAFRSREVPESAYAFNKDADEEIGTLKLSSFDIMNMEAYFTFLDNTFLQLKQSGLLQLVVDLRDNQGGHPIFAAQLFSYLTNHEFTWFKKNADIAEFEPLYISMQPKENHFEGNIYVLVNGACLSTTGHLISQLKYHTDALFIGEEPGSSFLCNDFSIQETLPNSGIEVNIPRSTFITAVTGFDDNEPFPLDYLVNVTVEDLLQAKDRYMIRAKEIIASK